MLYKIILSAFLIFPVFLNAQERKNDTLFLEKSTKEGSSQSVYFDTHKNSKAYNEISNFDFNEFDEQSYQSSFDYLRENNVKITKQKIILPIKKWVILHQYKNKLYAYKPCDFISHYQVSITDSVYIDYTGEGPIANKIVSQKKVNNNTYKLHLNGVFGINRILTIKLINQEKGIAIFKEQNGNDFIEYVMIDATKIKKVPLIVNRCDVHKQQEFEFDTIDFEKLYKDSIATNN